MAVSLYSRLFLSFLLTGRRVRLIAVAQGARLRLVGLIDLFFGGIVENKLPAVPALGNGEVRHEYGNGMSSIIALTLVGDVFRPHFSPPATRAKPGKWPSSSLSRFV